MALFRRSKARAEPPPGLPSGLVVYAIGDVHGRLDLLEQMTDLVAADAARLRPGEQARLIFLGDYVDRGPASKGVVDHLLALKRDRRFRVQTLKGNHEAALLAFLDDARGGPTWATYGGLETLRDYIGRAPPATADTATWEAVREAFIEAMPPEHLVFYQDLELYSVLGDYIFVHAGLRPGVALEDQKEHDLLSIRTDFLSAKRGFDRVVVHGHTPNLEPVIGPQRIGIDTGAFATGVLTCLKLSTDTSEFIQARALDAPSSPSQLMLA
jgi:serine/threonine protein phosphatase 1